MSSTLRREAAWAAENAAIGLLVLFVYSIGQAVVFLAISSDGTVAEGWSGSGVEQVIGWAIVAVSWGVVFTPFLVAFLAPYRMLGWLGAPPRLAAFMVALAIATLVFMLGRPTDPGSTSLALAIFGYASVVRAPGRSLPATARGWLFGFAMSFLWIIGPIAALAVAAHRIRTGALTEGAAYAIGGTAVPGLVMFADLFRDSVPAANYVIVAILLAGLVAGVGVLSHPGLAARVRR